MTAAAEFKTYVDFLARRIDRAELFQRLPDGWVQGAKGGPSWFAPSDHVREDAPRVFARPTSIGGVRGEARLHYAAGDFRLRRVTVVLAPLSMQGPLAPSMSSIFRAIGDVTADLAAREGSDLPCIISAGLHPHEDGVQPVIDIAPVAPPPEESSLMEEYFVYYD